MDTINLTPKTIVMNDGTVYIPSGRVARLITHWSDISEDVCYACYEGCVNVPYPKEGVRYITSKVVAQTLKRSDVLSAATDHPNVIRGTAGRVISVPSLQAW